MKGNKGRGNDGRSNGFWWNEWEEVVIRKRRIDSNGKVKRNNKGDWENVWIIKEWEMRKVKEVKRRKWMDVESDGENGKG